MTNYIVEEFSSDLKLKQFPVHNANYMYMAIISSVCVLHGNGGRRATVGINSTSTVMEVHSWNSKYHGMDQLTCGRCISVTVIIGHHELKYELCENLSVHE